MTVEKWNETYVDSFPDCRRVRVNYMEDGTVQLAIFSPYGTLCDVAYFDMYNWRAFLDAQVRMMDDKATVTEDS